MAYKSIKLNRTATEDETSVANSDFLFNKHIKNTYGEIFDISSVLAPNGDFLRISGKGVVLNSIKNLLSTPTGSYPFDPLYGSDLHKQIFEMNDDITTEQIINESLGKIKTYEKRVTVLDINIQYFSNAKGFRVNLLLKYNNENLTTTVDIVDKGIGK